MRVGARTVRCMTTSDLPPITLTNTCIKDMNKPCQLYDQSSRSVYLTTYACRGEDSQLYDQSSRSVYLTTYACRSEDSQVHDNPRPAAHYIN
ncbi:hypothetical protein J6590_090596 [Homalodisca vitripennis]|nr:hypothetical protein J6590_090596 [Homalodisca vitripennis]